MMLALILFVSSWVGSYLLYHAAMAAFHSEFGGMQGFQPYRCGGNQRALTWLEVIARDRICKDISVKQTDIRPLWVKLAGLGLDSVFLAGIGWFFLTLASSSSGVLGRLGLIYMGIGSSVFFLHLFWLGEIGLIGYHMRFVAYQAFWPLFAIFVRKARATAL